MQQDTELLQVPGFTALVASWQGEERLQATTAEASDGDSKSDIDGTARRQTRTDTRTEAETAAWQAATDAEAALKAPPCGQCLTCRAAVQANISVRPRAHLHVELRHVPHESVSLNIKGAVMQATSIGRRRRCLANRAMASARQGYVGGLRSASR